ncbi:MAG: methyltransferase domain-containing protein [Candidatus Omnitrophica bacterium]|nr:methyltransferase domain-containing protein [Candidatus Omnitrophota bacterium]MDD5079930.1 methyltransferase domain-containing protein [Candidatus Omnitrophota bacterium]
MVRTRLPWGLKVYKWDAKEYSKNSHNQKRWAEGLLSQIRFRGDETVLDIGCGDGKISCRISELVPRGKVLGIDSSREMIRHARDTFKGRHNNLFFQKKDACRLGFKNKFDVIFSNACFHWIADHDSLLNSAGQALKPGGGLVVQMGAKGNIAGVIKAGDKLRRRKKWRGYFKGFTSPYHFSDPAAFTALLKRHGFKIRAMRTFVRYMEYTNAADFRDSLRTIWMPYSHRAPERLREEFLAETIAQYLKEHPAGKKGGIRVKMKRLEFYAEEINDHY